MERNPTWYKDAIIYELHVRSFFDANNDGVGDFAGLTQKLDYLQDLGVTALWLLPFYPSPLKDDGYDIAHYTAIHPDYGTMEDFDRFMAEAHARGLKVITELVLNHTSDQHPWFRRARKAPKGSCERDFYVWSDTPEKYEDVRIVFKDFESSNWAWDPVARAYYWHRFYSHQPDLNFDNPVVHDAVFEVLDFWLEKGVDGLRLDAVPYLYEREGTSCDNLPETHAFLKKLRKHVDDHYDDRMLLAEANLWPEDSVAYYGDGDECHMNFHFPLMPRLFLAAEQEDRFPIIDVLEQTPPIPEDAQWAIFLRNHDELTLEMVTDEERDFMYRSFAQHHKARINLGIRRRLAPLMGNDRRKIELLVALLFSLPGTPVLYYGDELGMGDNFFIGDRNGVRTPMQWSGDRNAGFSRANPQELFLPTIIDPQYHYEAINVEMQQQNPSSLLWFTRRMIALRKRHPVLGRGTLRFLHPENRKVLAFLRESEEETLCVVTNLSRHPQWVDLDLSAHAGCRPRELFGHTRFPKIEEAPYRLSLGPHSTFWFSLDPREDVGMVAARATELPVLEIEGANPWDGLLRGGGRRELERLLLERLPGQQWFTKTLNDRIQTLELRDVIHVPVKERLAAKLAVVDVQLSSSGPVRYLIPLMLVPGDETNAPGAAAAYARLCHSGSSFDGFLVDALRHPAFAGALVSHVNQGDSQPLAGAWRTRIDRPQDGPLAVVMGGDNDSTSIAFGDRFVLKFFPRVEVGTNPEIELTRFLTEREYDGTPEFMGEICVQDSGHDSVLAVVHRFVEHEGDAWGITVDELTLFFERVLSGVVSNAPSDAKIVGEYGTLAACMGERTARLHLALASDGEPSLGVTELSSHYQRSLYQALRNLTGTAMSVLRKADLEGSDAARRDRLLEARDDITRRFSRISGERIEGKRIRIHGDLDLHQFLCTGRDVVIKDFEGDTTRTLSERAIPRNPLRDVASVLGSYREAANAAIHRLYAQGLISPTSPHPELETWAGVWTLAVRRRFVQAYLDVVRSGYPQLLPAKAEHIETLLELFLLATTLDKLTGAIQAADGKRTTVLLREATRLVDQGSTSTTLDDPQQ